MVLHLTAYASTDYSEDGKIVKLQQATEGKGVNIVLLGDGFTDRDFASGKYDKVMQQAKENLFNTEPMKSFRHLFNVYTVKAVSKNNVFIEGYETVFNGWFDGIVSAGVTMRNAKSMLRKSMELIYQKQLYLL